MTPCNAGDVVLVRFPFTDLTTSKKRPSIILSSSEYSDRFGDVVLMPLNESNSGRFVVVPITLESVRASETHVDKTIDWHALRSTDRAGFGLHSPGR